MKWDEKDFRWRMEQARLENVRLLEKWSKTDSMKLPEELRNCTYLFEKIVDQCSLPRHMFRIIEKKIDDLKKVLEDTK